jgi:hypothetical protein
MSGLNNRLIHTVIIQRTHIHIHIEKQEKTNTIDDRYQTKQNSINKKKRSSVGF